ncbi:sigma-54 dependent response regulator [Chlamydia abortus]|uniref:Response regulator n=1 Tax=Paenibacillus residui TaxID=629724 RepID=A0ABW3D6G2_9BACL|nr:response regulator [Paenibacillus sp. 32O-W]SHE11254.1 sigma-54 dependent response regulator [Chlamydia abortus]
MNDKHTILIVDDSPSNILLLQAILGEEYEVLYSTRGEKGLEMAQELQPDLILLDVMMPDMDGYAVCKQLKENPLTVAIPVIFITVLDHEEDEGNGLQAGAIDYITKPFNTTNIMMKIRNHLTFKDLIRHRRIN